DAAEIWEEGESWIYRLAPHTQMFMRSRRGLRDIGSFDLPPRTRGDVRTPLKEIRSQPNRTITPSSPRKSMAPHIASSARSRWVESTIRPRIVVDCGANCCGSAPKLRAMRYCWLA